MDGDLDIYTCERLISIGVSPFADLVVASAGEDKKISLWRKNGQSMGTIPVAGTDSGDNIEVILCKFYHVSGFRNR